MFLKLLSIISFLISFSSNASAQMKMDSINENQTNVRAVVPRLGIGVSRHFITEAGFAFATSRFTNHEQFGLNSIINIYYLSFELMTPYTKPLIYGPKIGAEFINVGHVTSAFGIEAAYYTKDTLTSFSIIPKMGIPLINGSLSYGFCFYTNSDMRKEIGRNRLTLTYSFNKKSDNALDRMFRSKPRQN